MPATDDDIETRLALVERDVAQFREQLARASSDATATRTLAAGADHDVSEVRAELPERSTPPAGQSTKTTTAPSPGPAPADTSGLTNPHPSPNPPRILVTRMSVATDPGRGPQMLSEPGHHVTGDHPEQLGLADGRGHLARSLAGVVPVQWEKPVDLLARHPHRGIRARISTSQCAASRSGRYQTPQLSQASPARTARPLLYSPPAPSAQQADQTRNRR
ncbi:MAG TPA: hypothetical protein VN748_15505 [Pseudonocardiaceae bacterium]|jgi:hypothetical protein|nr:hypothetical protein [Pseudonocardiaceae bacterium]